MQVLASLKINKNVLTTQRALKTSEPFKQIVSLVTKPLTKDQILSMKQTPVCEKELSNIPKLDYFTVLES